VAWSVNKAGKVYGRCGGDHDRKACGGVWTLGRTDSENMIRDAKKAAVKPKEKTIERAPGPEPTPEPGKPARTGLAAILFDD